DVVVWLEAEMRLMLQEEIARAILVGDGRDIEDEDKIDETKIRPIYGEDELYAATAYVNLTAEGALPTTAIDAIISSMKYYKGTGTPTFFTTLPFITTLLLMRDTLGRRLYHTYADIASEIGVSQIIACEALERVDDLVGISVN